MIRLALVIVSILPISSAGEQEGIHPGRYEPDHLIPLHSNPGDWHVGYMGALRPRLNMNAAFFLRMVILPSFDGETCLRLHGDNVDIAKSNNFVLTCYQAEKSIWSMTQENAADKKQGDVTVAVASVPVSKALAIRLRAVWDQMLSRTRLPEKPNTGCEGVTYEFSTPELTGSTWSPVAKASPLLFVELGGSLIRYCNAKPIYRAEVLKSVEPHVLALEKYLKEHPAR